MPPTGLQTVFGCQNRDCAHPDYKRAEDLWPALGAINSSRGDKVFGEIRGERQTLPPSLGNQRCDYERTSGRDAIVEPRRAVRGEIARALFYMHIEYELDLKGMLPMLKRWHRQIRT